ncbi:esterase E4-like isoform X2 [Planococcus citri]|uniref:esterase E4-like isoform X2 n=1 Tax=Planococcus citri TaxID=170843 RepID=UPI0031F7F45F
MSERVIVTVNEGRVRGIKQTSHYSSTEYYSFFAVPYGQPPENHLRFKDPVKVKPWKNIYEATVEKQGCAQFSHQTYQLLGTEDCLYSNIHTPKLPKKGDPLKPVIVNIHPGAFVYGSPDPNQYGNPAFIMNRDVVYVGIAYRLHILGFLNLRMKECSGNQGIKDIILGLEWIKSNIHFFGGDPDNITLLGSSSGGIVIQMLMVSPRSQGLFHKVVVMGCYLFSPVLPFEEENSHYAVKISQELGFNSSDDDFKKILTFLRKIPAQILVQQTKKHDRANYAKQAAIFPTCVFLPTLDYGDKAVLPEHPRKLLQSSMKIPVLFGITERESVMGFCRDLVLGTHLHFANSYCQNSMGWGYHLSEEQVQENYEKIKSFYQLSNPIENVKLSLKVDVQTDAAFSDIYDTMIDFVAPSATYVYKFEFEGEIKSTKDTIEVLLRESLPGSFHGSDFSYWNYVSDPLNKETQQMVEHFTKFISAFAKSGDPNYENCPVKWIPSTPETPRYLSINSTMRMVDGRLNHARFIFWDTLKKYSQNK